ncbi:MAG: AraC family transcriptional regulator [Vibrio sp.]
MIEKLQHDVKHETSWHIHCEGQLYWLTKGIILVETIDAQWPMTPGTLGWIPANCKHRAHALTNLEGWLIHVAMDSAYPVHPSVFVMDTFCHALLDKLTHCSQDTFPDIYLSYMVEIIGHELCQSHDTKLAIPMPVDRRARKIAEHLLSQPEQIANRQQLTQRFGISTRTLSRIFIKETGLTFNQWRQLAKLITSMQWLLDGMSVQDVAERSGYSNVSAYISAFKQWFAETPGQFQKSSCVNIS